MVDGMSFVRSLRVTRGEDAATNTVAGARRITRYVQMSNISRAARGGDAENRDNRADVNVQESVNR